MTIEKRGQKYRIRQMKDGKRYTIALDHKPSKSEAMMLISEEIRKNAVKPQVDSTFTEAVDYYCNLKSEVLSPTTVRGYHTIQRSLPSWFALSLLSSIDSVAVQRLVNELAIRHSAKTVKNEYGLVRSVMAQFCPNLVLRVTLPMTQLKEPYIPTEDDVRRLCEEAIGTEFWIPLMLGAYGLRRSEILAIDVGKDLNGCTLSINKSLVQNSDEEWVVKNVNKTSGSTREIYISEELADAIREQGYVFKGHPSTLFQWMSRTEKSLGMEHFSIHKLRHYFATVMSTLLPEKDWLYLGGWSSDHVAKRVYQHNQISKDAERRKSVSELYASKIAPKLPQNSSEA